MNEQLRRNERIRSRKDFSVLYREGVRLRGRLFSLVFRPNGLGYGRFGVVVSRKVGKAVVRNRVKRSFRDIYRRNKQRLPGSTDVIVLTRPEVALASRQVLEKSFLEALEKIA